MTGGNRLAAGLDPVVHEDHPIPTGQGGPLVADGKVLMGTKNHFWVFAEGKKPEVLSQTRLSTPAYSTPVAANGTLFIMSKKFLWAVAKDANADAAKTLARE